MNKIAYLIFLNCFFVLNTFSQQKLGSCGTTANDNFLIKQRMLENREAWKNKVFERNGALVYVPITYWAVAQTNGTGRVAYINIINNLCCLNKIYSEFGISFYLKAINNWDNQAVYDDPSSTLGRAYIGQKMQSNLNAVNIFVTNGVNAAETGVLAFYTSDGDYIVCGKKNLTASCPTLAHEIGHFFSLAHTFFGWEGVDYNTVTMTCTKPTPIVVPGSGALVEYVDRNKPGTNPSKKNCEEAADGFCDTPADYDLGFGWTGCNYNGCAKDPDNVQLDPLEINLMGYFLDCIKEFTPNQKDAITKDMLSGKRNFLRTVNYTVKPDVSGPVNYITPTTGTPALGYDTVKFDWDDVPNAEYYIFDLAQNIGFNPYVQSFIVKHSDTVLTNFKPGGTYFYRVTPFNSNSFCLVPKINNFKAPVWTVANVNIENKGISSYVLQSNNTESALIINAVLEQLVTIQILNSKGQMISSQLSHLDNGENTIQLDQVTAGIYFYRIISNNRKQNTGKFIKI